jgi:GntR family transcriptional regulator
MTIDPTDPLSPSKQIASVLRADIESGALAPGSKLPSERELSEHFGVAPQTAREAVKVLKNEGLAIGQAGKGVFVRQAPPLIRLGVERFSRAKRAAGMAAQQSEAAAQGLTSRQEVLELAEVPAPDWVAKWYDIEPGAPVFMRSRREWINEQPNQIAASYYRPEVVEGTAIKEQSTGPGGSYARLEERGHILTKFHEEIRTRMPNPDEVRQLRLPPGTPVVTVLRIAITADGPVEVFSSVMNGTSAVFVYDFDAPE